MSKILVINEVLAKKQLESAPKELQEYVYALQASNERWSEIYGVAIAKIKELSKLQKNE